MHTTRQKLTVSVAVAAAALVLTACGSTAPDDASANVSAGGGSAAGGPPVVPASAGHVHGMGVNPADGKLYLGTHGGTLVLDGKAFRTVGSSTVDLMGFAVGGPDHFYASGHPGPQDKLPDPVGLIESTDAGRTWKARSLGGQSDFHTLAAADGAVYGYDGTVKSSTDERTWVTGATDVAPASLAVDPQAARTVLATTEHGPVRSVDGGKTFTHLDGAPLLVFLAWTSPDAMWGVDPEGGVHLSSDRGTNWQARGSAGGPPAAFTAVDALTVTVALEATIVTSVDGGKTFAAIAKLA